MNRNKKLAATIAASMLAIWTAGCTMNLDISGAARSSLSSFLTGLVNSAIDQTVNPQN